MPDDDTAGAAEGRRRAEANAKEAARLATLAFLKRPSRANREGLDAALDAYERAVWGEQRAAG